MVSMGIGVVPMAISVAMAMPMIMAVSMVMRVIMIMTVRITGADALDMMMVTFLLQADLGLETQHLVTVLAGLTVHVACAFQNLVHAVDKGINDQGGDR